MKPASSRGSRISSSRVIRPPRLYALSSNMKTEFMLHLGNPFEEEKLPTWREYFDEHESIDIDDKEAVEEWWRGIAHLFHAGIEDDKKTRALKKAFDLGGDIFDLLVRYGADHTVFSVEEVTESRRKELIEWYLHRGMDWEQGYPIAHALARGQREFLGFCLGLRDKVPSARMQAAMALRKHCSEGRMRWVA